MNKQEWKYLFLIIVVFIAACIETDIYLPAFPDMMVFFSTTEEKIQSILTWNFLGICLSGPIYGPISDAIGRKKPLLVALGLFLVGSIMTLVAQSFETMLWGRLLQGLGSGGCFTLGTAIIFDTFQAEKATYALNHINSIIPFIMAGAPMLGGYLNEVYGFRSNFFAITLFVLISFLISILSFKETLSIEKRKSLQIKEIFNDCKKVACCIPFWQMTIVVSLIFAGYLAFLSSSAVLFVLELGVSKQTFPLYQAGLLITWLVGNLTFTRALQMFGPLKVKMIGVLFIALGGLGCVIFALLAPKNPIPITICMMIYSFGANWINGLYFPEGMELLPDIKGMTASILTSIRLLITAGVVGLTSSLYNATIYPIAGILCAIVMVIVPLLFMYERHAQRRTLKRLASSNTSTSISNSYIGH